MTIERRTFLSILAGAVIMLAVWGSINLFAQPLVRLTFGNIIFFGVYGFVLCFVMGQKDLCVGLLQEMGIWPLAKTRRRREPSQHSDA